jgi:hypothetical protein
MGIDIEALKKLAEDPEAFFQETMQGINQQQ